MSFYFALLLLALFAPMTVRPASIPCTPSRLRHAKTIGRQQHGISQRQRHAISPSSHTPATPQEASAPETPAPHHDAGVRTLTAESAAEEPPGRSHPSSGLDSSERHDLCDQHAACRAREARPFAWRWLPMPWLFRRAWRRLPVRRLQHAHAPAEQRRPPCGLRVRRLLGDHPATSYFCMANHPICQTCFVGSICGVSGSRRAHPCILRAPLSRRVPVPSCEEPRRQLNKMANSLFLFHERTYAFFKTTRKNKRRIAFETAAHA